MINSQLNQINGIENCRVCNKNKLVPILSLGNQCIINFTDEINQKTNSSPLELVLCNQNEGGCGLLQLKHTVPPSMLYKKFWYKSGVNQTMKNELTDIVNSAEKIVNLVSNDIVMDIGANDGTLLRAYKTKNLILVGFEPAENLMEEAKQGTTKIINDFFNYENFKKEFGNKKAKIITSIAMFYDLENPNKFVEDITKMLDENGIWIIQMNYLSKMLENNAFDNIVHEHLEYYSLNSLEHLLTKYGLEVFDVELNDINGGSIRTYIKSKKCKKHPTTNSVQQIRDYEERLSLDNPETYYQFATRIKNLKKQTFDFIQSEIKKGKKIYVYGASTRGNTLLQFYTLDNHLINAAVDRNPVKWGKSTIGTNIPIISEEQARRENPDYLLILPWYFLEEFKIREKSYLQKGGKFIVPLPEFTIIDSASLT